MIRAVCAFLLVFGMSWLASAEDAKPVTAILLVARAELPGQLQAEIARGDWTLAPAETGAIFDGKSEHPWPRRPAQGVGPRT